MADTYSDQLRIRLQENGANSATWGTITNTNFELFESSISGLATISTTGGTYALSETNGADDESRHAMLKVTGVLVSNSTIVVPSKTKNYTVWNATTGAYTVTIKTAAGTGVFVPRDGAVAVFCDGTNVYSTNRAAVDSTFSIYDETDPTKAVGFQVSGVTTATTRTLTVPDASGTIMLTSAIGSTVQAYDADLTTWAGITPGTNVGTALAVNVGTAGAFVVNGGALGTPSSGTLTNATGLPAAGVTGTALVAAAIGTTVQAYDATILKAAGGNMTGGINSARGNITQHATTMDFFAVTSPDILDGTGSAVTITACVNAPQAGATRKFYPIVATVLTHGATFDIAGNANLTAAAGDCWIIEAKTVSTYRVTAVKDDYEEGTFTGTLTGCTTSPTYSFRYTKVGKSVVIHIDVAAGRVEGTSNATTKTVTGIPSTLYPSQAIYGIASVADNGGSFTPGFMTISTTGVISFYRDLTGAGFTASGAFYAYPNMISYPI